jgi:hypothetical protein
MEVSELAIRRPESGPHLDTAMLALPLHSLVERRDVPYAKGWEHGLGRSTTGLIELRSGRQCLLQQLHDAPEGLRDQVRVMAEPADDQDDVVEAVLAYFGLDNSAVSWTAPRPFREYGASVCVLRAELDELATRYELRVTRSDDSSGAYTAAEMDLGERRVLLLDRPPPDRYAGVEVQSRWDDDPREAREDVLHALGLDESAVIWSPDGT